MWVFYTLATLVLWQGIVSVLGGVRYLRYVQDELAKSPNGYAPFVSIIVPCRGVDQELGENLTPLWEQDYKSYELIFVFDNESDPALDVVRELQARFDNNEVPASRILIAGQASGCGQKVHNLTVGVGAANERSDVLVFVDTDARPHAGWLRSLVAPLADDAVGATTGYRWFVPARGGAASHLRSVWNASIASALGGNRRGNFCWGGSTAIRRSTFQELNVLEAWRGALSDDFALTNTLQRAQRGIHFVPRCLVISNEDCTFQQLLEFTTRQMKITRVYAPRLWQIVLWSNLFFGFMFFGGILLVAARSLGGLSYAVPLSLLLAMFALGATKAGLRLRAVNLSLGVYRQPSTANAVAILAHLCLWPFASTLYLVNALASLFSRRIEWRGILYELKSERETAIISRVENRSSERENERAPDAS